MYFILKLFKFFVIIIGCQITSKIEIFRKYIEIEIEDFWAVKTSFFFSFQNLRILKAIEEQVSDEWCRI